MENVTGLGVETLQCELPPIEGHERSVGPPIVLHSGEKLSLIGEDLLSAFA